MVTEKQLQQKIVICYYLQLTELVILANFCICSIIFVPVFLSRFAVGGGGKEERKREKKSLSESSYMLKFWVHNKWSSLICSISDVFLSFLTAHTTPCFSNLVYCQILPLLLSLPFSVDIFFFWFGQKKLSKYDLFTDWKVPQKFVLTVS